MKKEIIFSNNLTEEQQKEIVRRGNEGNISAKLEMIIHNQGVIFRKLKKDENKDRIKKRQ